MIILASTSQSPVELVVIEYRKKWRETISGFFDLAQSATNPANLLSIVRFCSI